MKRTLVLLTAAALAATPAVADAAKPKAKPKPKPTTRVVTWDYNTALGASGVGTACAGAVANCIDIPTEKHETKVTFAAVDATGQKVALQYHFGGDYRGTVQDVCASGSTPVAKGTVISFNTILSPACPGLATTGTVTVTITGLK